MKRDCIFSRVSAAVMAVMLIFSLSFTAYAADDAGSAELVLSSDGLNISAKISVSEEEEALSAGASMTYEGQELAGLTAYFSAKALALESTVLDKPYGIALENLAENLEKSVFAPDSGSIYALDEDVYNRLMDALSAENAQEIYSDTELAAIGESVNVIANALSDAFASVSSYLTMSVANAVLNVNGEDISVNQISYSGDSAMLLALYDALAEELASDEELQSAVAVLIDLAAARSDEISVTGQEAVQTILENKEELHQSLESNLEETPFTLSFTASTTAQSQFVGADLSLAMGEDAFSVSLRISEAQDYYLLEMASGGSTFAAEFEITEDTEEALALRYAIYSDNEEAFAVMFTLDKSAQTFELSYGADGEAAGAVSGYYESSDEMFSLVVDKINGEEFGGTLALNLRSADTLMVPDFTELLDLNEEEINSVLQKLSDGLEELQQFFGE